MRIDPSVSPTNPYHIARAYNVARGVGASAPNSPAGGVRAPQAIEPKPDTQAPNAISRLVGAVVPGGVDFSGEVPRASEPALSFYRHPADKNAAATGVQLGRSLDISG